MQLILTLSTFFIFPAVPLLADHLSNSTVSSRGLLGSIALVIMFTAWRYLRSRRQVLEFRRDATLRRRALLHLKDQSGETGWRAVFWLAAAVFGMLYLSASLSLSLAAEPVPFLELMNHDAAFL